MERKVDPRAGRELIAGCSLSESETEGSKLAILEPLRLELPGRNEEMRFSMTRKLIPRSRVRRITWYTKFELAFSFFYSNPLSRIGLSNMGGA